MTTTMSFDPFLLGAIRKALGRLPELPGNPAKIRSLTFRDGLRLSGPDGQLLNRRIAAVRGDFSALRAMPDLHTLRFRNRRPLHVGDFSFLPSCRKLKHLDLSGTDFSDCSLLEHLPCLRNVLLPDRRQLVHPEVLDRIPAQAEPEPERDGRSPERSRSTTWRWPRTSSGTS